MSISGEGGYEGQLHVSEGRPHELRDRVTTLRMLIDARRRGEQTLLEMFAAPENVSAKDFASLWIDQQRLHADITFQAERLAKAAFRE